MIRKKILIAFGLLIATGLILSAASRWTDIVFWGSKTEASDKTSVWISAGWLRLARTERTEPLSQQQLFIRVIARQQDKANYFLVRWHVTEVSVPERYNGPNEPLFVAAIVREYAVRLWLICIVMALPLLFFWWLDRRHIPPHCCQSCGYDLTGNTSGVCPECGQALALGEGSED
jgi:hypothetical protein